MKTAILAGGDGTRLAEETGSRPKALVEIGGRPIIWHVMKRYAEFGTTDFVVALGYKGDMLREYLRQKDPVSPATGEKAPEARDLPGFHCPPEWNVELVETGLDTRTGGRIKRLEPYLENETFMLTWCDGLADINFSALLDFHRSHGKLATLTAVHPPERFGRVELDGDRVSRFSEKPRVMDRWINGAFFVLEPGIFDYIENDETQWEKGPMERLAADGQLMAFRHTSFWQCMDTIHDRLLLEKLWASGDAPWKMWK